jgi:hypothetical protein
MLKPAEVAAEFLKQQPQFAEMGGIGHAGSQYGALRFALHLRYRLFAVIGRPGLRSRQRESSTP